MTKERLRKQTKDPDVLQIAAMGTPERAEWDAVFPKYKQQTEQEHDEVVEAGRPAHLRHGAPRIAAHRQPAPRTRRTPGRSRSARASILSLQDDLLRIFGGERMQNLMLRLGMEEDVPIESQADHQAHRRRAEGRGSAELRRPQTPPRIRRRDEQAAPGGLRHAPRLARRQRPEGAHQRNHRGHPGRLHRRALARKSASRRSGIGPACRPTCSRSSA